MLHTHNLNKSSSLSAHKTRADMQISEGIDNIVMLGQHKVAKFY